RADALYVELTGGARDELGATLNAFRVALESQDTSLIESTRDRLAFVVNQLRRGCAARGSSALVASPAGAAGASPSCAAATGGGGDDDGTCDPACLAAGGTCQLGVCVIDVTSGGMITCPPGLSCQINCNSATACTGGIDCRMAKSCSIGCNVALSCTNETVQC